MMRKYLNVAVSIAALVGLIACIPIRSEVSLSGTGFPTARVPLAPDEGVAILGWVREGSSRRFDDRTAACVRNAVARTSPSLRVVPVARFQSAVGGPFLTLNPSITEDETRDALQDAVTSSAFIVLQIRYVFMVEGATETSDHHYWSDSSPPVAVASWSKRKRTNIQVTTWDPMTGHILDSFSTSASGLVRFETASLVLNSLEYAPTESTACSETAKKIESYTSGKTYADADNGPS